MERRNHWLNIIMVFTLCFAVNLFPTRFATGECTDDFCPIPTVNENDQTMYAIVSPVGYHAVEMIAQAPRLTTLHGKRIALVGGSFMASVTHDELRQCILEKYPDAKIYMFKEVGAGGPYSVFGQSSQTIAFQNKLKELGIDAVISGNCGCGLCTTKETGSAIAAEYIGIPAVTVGAPTFIAQIHSTGVNRGVPVLRTAEYPGAFASDSEAFLRRNTRETLWPQVEAALTQPLTPAEAALYAADGKRPFDEIIYTGTFEEVQDFCLVNDWTDGLPIVPPTDAMVRDYLCYTPYRADDVLGIYPLAYRECTVYTVAANAVMAGVPKEMMPICIALTQGLNDGEWRRPLASTHGWTPYAWINGPIARQLGIDHGQGMISEQKNKALGRFIDLMMLNVGGYYVKENRMGTFGYLTPFVFSEDEEACQTIGWTPYHVQQGYSLNSSTVTAASALSWGNNVTPATDDPERIMQLMAFDMTEKQQNGLGNTNPQVYRTLLITEPVARDLAAGYRDKEALEDDLVQTARRPLFMRAYASYWANTGSVQSTQFTFDDYYSMMLQDPQEQAALTETPDWLRGVTDQSMIETIAAVQKGQTAFLLCGDNARNKFMTLPGGGYVTIEIKLPEHWDDLVTPLGYEPLSHFLLDEQIPDPSPDTGSASPASSFQTAIHVPDGLADGVYRLVPSAEQLNDQGRVYRSSNGAASAWSYGGSGAVNLAPQEPFSSLMKALYSGCSFTVEHGKVIAVTLRPQTAGQKNSGNASGLTSDLLEHLTITMAVVQRQSKAEGKTTEDGASLTISTRLAKFKVELGGTATADRGNTPHFLMLDGSSVTLNPKAEAGASAKIGVRRNDGSWQTLTFTKQDQRTIKVEYHRNDRIKP